MYTPIDEFIFKCTHDKVIDWLLPGVPPTGKYLEIPMMGVINIRGDRLYHGMYLPAQKTRADCLETEHIWWDQATALMQAGIIPSHVPWPLNDGKQVLRLPVAGVECARLLEDETSGKSNEMFNWGVKDV